MQSDTLRHLAVCMAALAMTLPAPTPATGKTIFISLCSGARVPLGIPHAPDETPPARPDCPAACHAASNRRCAGTTTAPDTLVH